MIILLTSLSCFAAVLLLAVVAVYLFRIAHRLEEIGGPPISRLAKIRFGLRAIETETSHLGPQVTMLNNGLKALDGGVRQVATDLGVAVAKLRA
ncbi:MAG: hypothetical protein M3Z22_04985 [Verrucomicrobiota bacterium]|nr:hypothetical protein [Verrucomicrobiota bacterium]